MRIDGWEERLSALIAEHKAAAKQWGEYDCWMLAMSNYTAMTGEKLYPELRGYKSEKGGYKKFAKLGFVTVKEALDAVLPTKGKFSAMRGDLAVVERGGVLACGVVTSTGIATWAEEGLIFMPVGDAVEIYGVA